MRHHKYTYTIKKAKKGYKWFIYQDNEYCVEGIGSTKKLATKEAEGWIDYYKKSCF
jgi:hypothetical protein